MRRETVGTTVYRLVFGDADEQTVHSAALIDALGYSEGYKPRTVWVLDSGWKCVDQESIDVCWNKITIARLLTA
jgi:hypothetical protein